MIDLLVALTGFGTLVVAVVGVWIALLQIRNSSRDAHASRAADMSWQIYQAYVEPRIRDARGAAEAIAHSSPVPHTAVEYAQMYADKSFPLQEEANADLLMRRLLRFYNQVGILVEKGLVDEDFVYAMIGSGLDSSWPAVSVAVEYYQNYYSGISGHDLAEPRPIHAYVISLHNGYLAWAESTGQALLRNQRHELV